MIIALKKFGTTLVSRQSGREALAGFQQTLRQINNQEEVIIDFEGVHTFTPSWGDEFLTPLKEAYGNRLILLKTENPSVLATVNMLGEISHKPFLFRS